MDTAIYSEQFHFFFYRSTGLTSREITTQCLTRLLDPVPCVPILLSMSSGFFKVTFTSYDTVWRLRDLIVSTSNEILPQTQQ